MTQGETLAKIGTELPDTVSVRINIELPPEATIADLENITLPLRPYSIYANIHNNLQEAHLSLRELLSHQLSAYIVPVNIKGNVAQSLFGVTQDGKWYRILVGYYNTKKSARKTLHAMMEKLPNYHLEIMKYAYTIECGRFLTKEKGEDLYKQLSEGEFFPYSQSYLTQNEKVIWRIMVGCFFSSQGAQILIDQLEEQGYSCKITKR